jgi:hypothetical protein
MQRIDSMEEDLTFIETLGHTRKSKDAGTHHHIPIEHPLGRIPNSLLRVCNEPHDVREMVNGERISTGPQLSLKAHSAYVCPSSV